MESEAFSLEKTFRVMEYFCKQWLCYSPPLTPVPNTLSITTLLTSFSSVQAPRQSVTGDVD